MTVRRGAAAEEAYAIGLIQQLAAMCDETRRSASTNPARIAVMLESFEETLAMLAPQLERLGSSAASSRDAVLSAAHFATESHQSLIDAMQLELDRLARAIAESDHAASATLAYASAQPLAAREGFQARG